MNIRNHIFELRIKDEDVADHCSYVHYLTSSENKA